MGPKSAAILNYAIGVALMTIVWFVINKKSKENPQLKLYGLSLSTIKLIILVGLGIAVTLILLTLLQ